ICFGGCLPPDTPSFLMLAYSLIVDFYGFSSFRNLLHQNLNLPCNLTFRKIFYSCIAGKAKWTRWTVLLDQKAKKDGPERQNGPKEPSPWSTLTVYRKPVLRRTPA
ncbi:MAG: hypothetical protein IKG87_05245, partial [Clostridia bacterium]|nr:hypothetical protein [Clostridia bacterium]